MRYVFTLTAILLLAFGVVFAQTHNSKESPDPNKIAEKEKQAIPVADFQTKTIVGSLGHPLGTVVRVTGVAIDGDGTGMKRDGGKTLLEIHTANGQDLKNRVVFDFLRAPKTVAEPKPGEKFDYYVHEYGAFDGVVVPPRELNIDSPMIAHDGFYYRKYIAIHKSLNEPARRKPTEERNGWRPVGSSK